ncbi:MAG: glycosyltransferase [Aphanocapsa sp. GSE-SYN-MK-11-07L]|jgi:predicted O-linked N-acetylglucosamine transferase (SPINDLY family)/glycosyltransferase involved in cell wall biosynthesis|nr:glycosyltransferase [Aphanocapsa sp. GSE-SYN-MK-11-07L]
MRIVFVDLIPFDYQVESAYQQPLGGSQSALCYLTEALARLGHDVFLLTASERVNLSRGVICLSLKLWSLPLINTLQPDALILLNVASGGLEVKPLLPPQTHLIFWTGHASDQPGVQCLANPQDQDAFDFIVMVSEWQQECYAQELGIPLAKLKVLRNAVAPCFNAKFVEKQPILAIKENPPILAYTSTPFRGLNILLEIFPQIRAVMPGTRLRVFSSMKVYQVAAEQDEYQDLYQQCLQMEGVDYIGSLAQNQLAQELQSINALVYPNTFPETSCIAVMEAMASGCQIITSELGGLPETTAGFAHLVPIVEGDREGYKEKFVEVTVKALQQALQKPFEAEQHLQQQVAYVNHHYTWAARAKEWEKWLESICTEQPLWLTAKVAEWQQQAQNCWQQGNYEKAIDLYEEGIADNPTEILHYWHWGVLLLLVGREEEAQVAWSMVMADGEPEQVEAWTHELVKVLEQEAQRQETLKNQQGHWLIRRHLREILPENLENLLRLLHLELALGSFTPDLLIDWQLQDVLQKYAFAVPPEIWQTLLPDLLQAAPEDQRVTNCLQIAWQYLPDAEKLIGESLKLAYSCLHQGNYNCALSLTERCLSLEPTSLKTIRQLSFFYLAVGRYAESLSMAQHYVNACKNPAKKLIGHNLALSALLAQGEHNQTTTIILAEQMELINDLLTNQSRNLEQGEAQGLIAAISCWPYLQDQPDQFRHWQNQLAALAQKTLRRLGDKSKDLYIHTTVLHSQENKVLKIGYVGHTLRQHSVGWLSRWLFKYYNRTDFQVMLYLLNQEVTEFTQIWFTSQVDGYWSGVDSQQLIEKISKDKIDILVDLDSCTHEDTAAVFAYKPAPIQVTWLGWDASGLPAVDYFIADPYVLPDVAQTYYQEKIWRLPDTYIAVDGFEVWTPSLRREDLEIPSEAIIYLSNQIGQKQHPDILRLQMKILKLVPNSYLLIKVRGESTILKETFINMAETEDVAPQRLRFLPLVNYEPIHRANLTIADVFLDTYPYNGATTTLEALWMGLPIVTKVGQQFAARNSYTFLMNVGVSEGIAWTDDEYVEWGVRFGKDLQLRQDVACKLKASRQTSPLWNAKKFTSEMEKAFRQMWEIYSQGSVI